MTKPKMVLCEMSGKPIDGPRELDGTAYCPNPKCRSTIAPTRKVESADGKFGYVYGDHYRRAHPPRWKGKPPRPRPRDRGRDGGRRH